MLKPNDEWETILDELKSLWLFLSSMQISHVWERISHRCGLFPFFYEMIRKLIIEKWRHGRDFGVIFEDSTELEPWGNKVGWVGRENYKMTNFWHVPCVQKVIRILHFRLDSANSTSLSHTLLPSYIGIWWKIRGGDVHWINLDATGGMLTTKFTIFS